MSHTGMIVPLVGTITQLSLYIYLHETIGMCMRSRQHVLYNYGYLNPCFRVMAL